MQDHRNQASNFRVLYDTELSVPEKVEILAKEIYRADGVTFTAPAKKALAQIEALGASNLPVCMAKTQYSLSDDPPSGQAGALHRDRS